jgi:ABC-type sugar transport system ATPase subunit
VWWEEYEKRGVAGRVADALISFQDVALGYDGVPVLEGLALDVLPGDFLALLGPNGCGKSTILKAMAGILRPLRGVIRSAVGDRAVRRTRGPVHSAEAPCFTTGSPSSAAGR